MAPLTAKSPKPDRKIYIRCDDDETRRGFKRVAADFDTYEDVIKWIVENYDKFKKIASPTHPVRGGVL